MTSKEYLKGILGLALSDTTLLQDAFGFVCDLKIARSVAADVLICAIDEAYSKTDAAELYKKIAEAIELRYSLQMYVDRVQESLPLARKVQNLSKEAIHNMVDVKQETAPFKLPTPTQNPGVVITEWLLAKLDLLQRKVILLLRFPDASFSSVTEDLQSKGLQIDEIGVQIRHSEAMETIKTQKDAADWKDAHSLLIKTETPTEKETPTKKETLKIYEADWRRSVEELAYLILCDRNGARHIAEEVKAELLAKVEGGYDFDSHTAWNGNNESWIGLKSQTFHKAEAYLLEYAEKAHQNARPKPDDEWAKRVIERLFAEEAQCFLLSTIFHKRDDDGVNQIRLSLKKSSDTVRHHIAEAIKKMLNTNFEKNREK